MTSYDILFLLYGIQNDYQMRFCRNLSKQFCLGPT